MGCDRRSWGDAIGRGARLRRRVSSSSAARFFFRHSLGVSVGVCLVFAPAVPAFVSSRRVPHAGQRRRCVRRGRVREQKRRFVSHASFRVPVCPSPDVPFGVPPLRRRRRRSERRERRVFDRIARFPRVIRVCRVHTRVPQSMKRHRARVAQRRRGGERASPRRRGRTHRSNRRVLLVRCSGGVDASVQRPEKHAKHASTARVCSTLLLGTPLLLGTLLLGITLLLGRRRRPTRRRRPGPRRRPGVSGPSSQPDPFARTSPPRARRVARRARRARNQPREYPAN